MAGNHMAGNTVSSSPVIHVPEPEVPPHLLEFFDMITNPVPLHPDLVPFVEDTEVLGPVLRHPLVYAVPYREMLNAQVNQSYEIKCADLVECRREENWFRYIWLHERPYRLDALRRIADLLDDEDYWMLVADVWIDSENIRDFPEEWDEMLTEDRPCREFLMSEEERAALAALVEAGQPVTVYQGHTDARDDGWSWTLDRDIAVWFAKRFAGLERGTPMLSSVTVDPSDIVALFLRRSEQEVLLDPSTLDHVRTASLDGES